MSSSSPSTSGNTVRHAHTHTLLPAAHHSPFMHAPTHKQTRLFSTVFHLNFVQLEGAKLSILTSVGLECDISSR